MPRFRDISVLSKIVEMISRMNIQGFFVNESYVLFKSPEDLTFLFLRSDSLDFLSAAQLQPYSSPCQVNQSQTSNYLCTIQFIVSLKVS